MLKPGQKRNVMSMYKQIQDIKANMKEAYAKIDELEGRIIALVPVGVELEYPRLEKVLKVVDVFADRNVSFAPAAVRRFVIKMEDA